MSEITLYLAWLHSLPSSSAREVIQETFLVAERPKKEESELTHEPVVYHELYRRASPNATARSMASSLESQASSVVVPPLRQSESRPLSYVTLLWFKGSHCTHSPTEAYFQLGYSPPHSQQVSHVPKPVKSECVYKSVQEAGHTRNSTQSKNPGLLHKNWHQLGARRVHSYLRRSQTCARSPEQGTCRVLHLD